MNGRSCLAAMLAGWGLGGLAGAGRAADPVADVRGSKPNIVFVLADDLGYAELGCYGQKHIRTPNIDRLAAEGRRFTQAYSGNTVCAPSRCVLLTGKHGGHSYIRDNAEVGTWDSFQGQAPLPEGTVTIASLLKARGYATACVGKWGLGAVGSSGAPARQGFDLFFGYNCQRHAHNHYPAYLWRNDRKVALEGNTTNALTGKQYAPDLMAEEALGFIRRNRDQPFFLYYATPVPHAALQAPADALAAYAGKLGDKPYDGSQGYLPHPEPRAAYAAMVTRLDRDVGRVVALLKELGLADRTLVVFTSDNGPTFNGGTDSAFFDSNGPLNGLKCSLYEGGIRVPFIARWPGRIAPGATTGQPVAFWDLLPTFAELAGAPPPADVDGFSLLPTLLGQAAQQKQHEYLYWENRASHGGGQALRWGNWKAIRMGLRKNPAAPVLLFDLAGDPGETTDVAAQHPDVVATVEKFLRAARVESPLFPLFTPQAAAAP